MIVKRILCASLLALLPSVFLHASKAPYMLADPETIIAQLPPPPADDSPAGMADVSTLLQVQKDRTPEQVRRAQHVALHTPMNMGASVFGPEFTKDNLPLTNKFLLESRLDRRRVSPPAKKIWNRVRPYNRGLGIDPCVYRPADGSYPSGHSAGAASWAVFYSHMYPEYTMLFDAEVEETMWSRVLGGVHYPSDTQAGKLLGTLMAKEILKNPAALKRLDAMRAEIEDFLKKNPQALVHAQSRLTAARRAIAAREKTTIRVVSYNIHIGLGLDGKTDLQRIADVLGGLKADVILLQEVDVHAKRSGNVNQIAELGRLMGMHYYFAKALDRSGGEYGNAILSKHPFLYKSTIPLEGGSERRSAGIVEVELPPRKVEGEPAPDHGLRVLLTNVHLDHKLRETHVEHVKKISAELARLTSERPIAAVVWGGDFNANETSPIWKLLENELGWTVPQKYHTSRATFPANNPRTEIDWFVYRTGSVKNIKLSWRENRREFKDPLVLVASDHLPILLELAFDEGK